MTQTLTAGDDLPEDQPTLLVRAGSPTALLTLVPHLLGFVPEASLVVIGVAPPRDRIRVTLRYDLPDPSQPGLVADLAAHAVGVLRTQRLTAAVAIGYGPESLVMPVADDVRDAACRAGIDVREFLRVQEGRYWSYLCRNEACCPAAGTPFDPAAADPAEAAALDRLGGPVLAGRAAVAARVAPLGGIAAESMRQATRRAERHIAQLLAKVRKSARLGAVRHMIVAEGLAAVGAMIARYRDGGRFATDDEIARISVALRDLRVRDDAWARMDPAHAAAHQRLWIERGPAGPARLCGRARRTPGLRRLAVRGGSARERGARPGAVRRLPVLDGPAAPAGHHGRGASLAGQAADDSRGGRRQL